MSRSAKRMPPRAVAIMTSCPFEVCCRATGIHPALSTSTSSQGHETWSDFESSLTWLKFATSQRWYNTLSFPDFSLILVLAAIASFSFQQIMWTSQPSAASCSAAEHIQAPLWHPWPLLLDQERGREAWWSSEPDSLIDHTTYDLQCPQSRVPAVRGMKIMNKSKFQKILSLFSYFWNFYFVL